MRILQLLKEPYPLNSVRTMTWFAAFVAAFVFVFLTFFQPFGIVIDSLESLLRVTSSYGLITFFTIVLFTVSLRSAFPKYFLESRWVFGRELLITMFNFLLIGVFNILYSNYVFNIGLSMKEFFMFQCYTLGVGFFPILFYMILKYTRLLRSNILAASDLSDRLAKGQITAGTGLKAKIRIHSELKKDDLEIFPEDLLYAETADNYIAVFHFEKDSVAKTLVRSTLGKLESETDGFPHLVRCHRAFLVNLVHVVDFKGNAQGLQLRLERIEQAIPVSRNMVGKIKSMIDK